MTAAVTAVIATIFGEIFGHSIREMKKNMPKRKRSRLVIMMTFKYIILIFSALFILFNMSFGGLFTVVSSLFVLIFNAFIAYDLYKYAVCQLQLSLEQIELEKEIDDLLNMLSNRKIELPDEKREELRRKVDEIYAKLMLLS
jgi:hypothetical protein